MDIRVYTLEELESHIRTTCSKPHEVTPLSPLRLTSYLRNPRAEKTDPVLFELRLNEKLIAYRTLLPDHFMDQNGQNSRFAWLSGNWVDPEFRRKGLSSKLLQEAESVWDSRLMYTNYAPASKAVYDQTKQFTLLAKRDGKRYYLRAATEELLGERLGARDLLRLGDRTVNQLREHRLLKFKPVENSACKVERISTLDPQLKEIVQRMQKFSLFGRTPDVFKWILQNPWLTEDKGASLNYPFSFQVARHENLLYKFTLRDKSTGLLWLMIHNRTMSAPYVFSESDQLYPLMAQTLIHQMIREDCAHTTIRNPQLEEGLVAYKKWFLTIRSMPQQVFAHQKLTAQIPPNKEIRDGDGDVVFTG
jgi:GNAT superfamily N-acetyltransferase